MDSSGDGTKMSGNRKYVQLTLTDARDLLSIVIDATGKYNTLERAVDEMVKKAEEQPGKKLCLAYAVVRGGGDGGSVDG